MFSLRPISQICWDRNDVRHFLGQANTHHRRHRPFQKNGLSFWELNMSQRPRSEVLQWWFAMEGGRWFGTKMVQNISSFDIHMIAVHIYLSSLSCFGFPWNWEAMPACLVENAKFCLLRSESRLATTQILNEHSSTPMSCGHLRGSRRQLPSATSIDPTMLWPL